MGQDIDRSRFERRDFLRFQRRLHEETELLHALVEQGALSPRGPVAGLELEAWLIDCHGRPAPRNEELLAALAAPEVVTEIGRFNFELNVPPQPTAGQGLARLGADLQAMWQRCRRAAADLGLGVAAIGILPSVTDAELALPNLSDRIRYRALNQQVLRQRHGRPIRLDIDGAHGEHLHSEHVDVMLEAAATSLQLHLQLGAEHAARAYNAAIAASAPLVALTANSPLLFGHRLWQETRIPLFEQALNLGAREDGHRDALGRVGFGSGYAGFSLVECFRENAERFEPLLPVVLDEPLERLAHLRLHNGTIWRWNRPLLGFDGDGTPHFRIEHRPLAAGPTLADMMADLAFALGLAAHFALQPQPPESRLPFEAARRNFYAAARDGLDAELQDLDGAHLAAADWLLELLQPAADGLDALGVDSALAGRALALVEARLAARCNGARWQLQALARLDGDLGALTREYAARQAEGAPLHTWT